MIDASIPLQVQVPKPDNQIDQAAKAYTLKSAMQQSEMGGLQLEQAKKSAVSDEKIKGIFQQQDAFTQDENGQRILSPAAIQKVFAVDPTKGMALQENHLQQVNAGLKMKHMVSQMDGEKLAQSEKKMKLAGDAALGARDAYMGYLKDAPNDVAGATEVAKAAYSTQLQGQVKAGIMKPEEAEASLKNFSPAAMSMQAMTSGHYLQTVAEERKARAEKAKEQRDEQMMMFREKQENRRTAAIAGAMGGDGKPPSGYRKTGDGNLEPIPGGPADVKQGEGAAKEAERKQVNLDRQVTHFSENLQKTNVPAFDTILNDVKSELAKYKDKDLPGVGRVAGSLPDFLVSPEGRELRRKIATLRNIELKDRSGAAVTDNEMQRYLQELGTGKLLTDKDFKDAVKNIETRFSSIKRNAAAGASDDVLKEYETRGGMKIQRGEGGKSDGGGDIASKVKASGATYEPSKYDYRIGPDGAVQRKPK